MKPEIDQEIWHIFVFFGGLRLRKRKVGYMGKEGFVCYRPVMLYDCPIRFDDYGTSWFLTKEEGLKWLKKNDYEWSEFLCAYVEKGEEE